MTYRHIHFTPIQDRRVREALKRADWYLLDVYGMFRRLPPKDRDGGGGNFSIVLVLLCIIDGLATEVWPGRVQEKDQQRRFKKLIQKRLLWGPVGKGKWVDKGNAADQLYTEFRNPLVHELASDKKVKSRPHGYVEPLIGKWGNIPIHMRSIEKIDALNTWDKRLPVLTDVKDKHGKPRYKLTAVALYWAVKRLAEEMAVDSH